MIVGRMIDHVMNTMSVDLDDIEVIVLDEADRLLELGFTDEVLETYTGLILRFTNLFHYVLRNDRVFYSLQL